jgi:hypothetical protein
MLTPQLSDFSGADFAQSGDLSLQGRIRRIVHRNLPYDPVDPILALGFAGNDGKAQLLLECA